MISKCKGEDTLQGRHPLLNYLLSQFATSGAVAATTIASAGRATGCKAASRSILSQNHRFVIRHSVYFYLFGLFYTHKAHFLHYCRKGDGEREGNVKEVPY